MQIRVDCYAGYRGEETPRLFWIPRRKVEVEDVLDRWLSPDHRYFKVRGDDGDIYILRYDVPSDHWEMTFYSDGSAGAGTERSSSAEQGVR